MTLPETILHLASLRGSDKTICPSEVARNIWPDNWRKHMAEVRNAAFHLRDEGKVQIKQKGKPVEGNELVGPIRIAIVK
jgi:hypothetical protein